MQRVNLGIQNDCLSEGRIQTMAKVKNFSIVLIFLITVCGCVSTQDNPLNENSQIKIVCKNETGMTRCSKVNNDKTKE